MADLTSFWRAVEAIHDVVYFGPDTRERYQRLGLKGYWMGYVASRAGALGPVPPAVVTATFHGFAPTMIARAVPDAWRLADRDAVLTERLAIARDALTPVLAGVDVDAARLAAGLGEVVDGLDLSGLPLAAAEAALPVPDPADDAAGALWRRATVLRELRGDCHVAALVIEGLGGAAANALQVATGRAGPEQQGLRGWSDEEWTAARAGLQAGGWVDDTGRATLAGRSTRDRLEETTDRACANRLDVARTERVEDVTADLLLLARAVADTGAVPYPNPTGVPRA